MKRMKNGPGTIKNIMRVLANQEGVKHFMLYFAKERSYIFIHSEKSRGKVKTKYF